MPRKRILIVDDEPALRHALRVTLTALGFDTAEAGSGEHALAVHACIRCDAVLLDVNMPGMGGIEACRELRRRDPGIQILMLTARDGETDRSMALEAGANGYFTKPYCVSDLVTRLNAGFLHPASS